MKAVHLVAALLSLSTLSTAWPGREAPFDGVKAVEDVGAMLFKRDSGSKMLNQHQTLSEYRVDTSF